MPVKSSLSEDNEELTISIDGRFNFEIMREFRAIYDNDQKLLYTIDLRQTERMDASALGMLLNMRKTLGEEVKISIVNCRPQIKKILAIPLLNKKFNIT